MDDSESGNPGRSAWARVLAVVLASWQATARAAVLVVLLVVLLVVIRLLAFDVRVGPIQIGSGG
jgi:hypothetical protein